jgi:acyl carrier protein
MQTIEDLVLDIVAKETRRERQDISLDTKIADIESLDLMQIMFAIEDQFDVYIPQDDESFKLETLHDVVHGIDQLLAQKQSGPAAAS